MLCDSVTTDPALPASVFVFVGVKSATVEGFAAQSSPERSSVTNKYTHLEEKETFFTLLQPLWYVQRENLNNNKLQSFHYLGEITTTTTVQSRILLPNILTGDPGEHIINAASPLEKINKLHCSPSQIMKEVWPIRISMKYPAQNISLLQNLLFSLSHSCSLSFCFSFPISFLYLLSVGWRK